MARYQKIKEVSGWDSVDTFYKREIKGINLAAFNFTRSFCKCGNVTDKFRDKCSVCGNFDFLEWTAGYDNTYICDSENFVEKTIVKGDEEITLGQNILLLETDDKKEKAIFSIVKDERLNISKNAVNEFSSIVRKKGYGGWYYRDNLFDDGFVDNALEDNYKYWDNYKIPVKLLKDKTFENLKKAIKLNDDFNKFVNDPKLFQYPSLAKFMVSDMEELKNLTVEDNIKHCKIPIEYMSALDYNCKLNNFRDITEIFNIKKSYYNSEYSLHESIESIKNKYLYGFESLLNHYFVSNLIDWPEFRDIIRKLKTIYDKGRDMEGFSSNWSYYKPIKHSYYSSYAKNTSFRDFFDITYMEYFEIFFKENIMNKRENIIEGFIEQIKQMQDLKIPIKEENFKLKNFNFLFNEKTLSTKYKLPDGKVEMFLDMFEVNPLEALELIKNRRKMTKKELEAFLEIMMKTS